MIKKLAMGLATCLLMGLFACSSSKVDDAAFNKMVNESWQKRKVQVKDSMNRVCSNRINTEMNAAVDSVLIKRGIKLNK